MNNGNVNNGMSLFQGANSVLVENDDRQQEEEEALEDQKRRHEELQNLIANAFDDIVYEDQNSTDNSICDETGNNSRSYAQNTSLDDQYLNMNDYKETSFNGTDQLRVLYEVRIREINSLSKQLDQVKSELKLERDASQKKILLLEADCEKTRLSHKQSQNLLVETKTVLNEKDKEIQELKEATNVLKISKEKNDEEVIYWKNTSDELQQRLYMIEKGIDIRVSEKQIRTRFEKEINDLQNALFACNTKLEKKEQEYRILQNNLKEAENAREMIIVDKAQIINAISSSLEEAQEQNQIMLSKITDLQIEKQGIQHELSSLKSTVKNKDNNISNNSDEIISTLQNELQRTLDEQTQKRNEIMKLENLIRDLRDNKLQEDIKIKDYEVRYRENIQRIEDLTKQNISITQENFNLTQTIEHLEENIKQFQCQISEKNILPDEQSDERFLNNEHYKEECNRLKHELNLLEEQMIKYKFWKERYTLCEEQCVKLQETMAQLNTKLFESQVTINNLKEKLALKEERDSLIEVLKTKAAMFEDYMSNKPVLVTTEDKMVCTEHLTEPDIENHDEHLQSIILSAENNAFHKVKQIFGSKLTELEKVLTAQNMKFSILSEENKNLKEKIIFDRNALSELTEMWTKESKKLNDTIQSLVQKNFELMEAANKLTMIIKEAEVAYGTLNSKLTDANNYINALKVANKRHEEHLNSEYNRVTMKFQLVLETIQKRVSKFLLHTHENMRYT